MVAGAVVLSGGTAIASIRAEARGLVFLILAFLLRLAEIGGTQGNLTKLTCKARGAEAKEGSWEVKAAGSRGARATQTLIYFCLAVWAFKAWETLAVEGSKLVQALPPIGAGKACTLVYVLLTAGACESWWAEALEGGKQVQAGAARVAGLGQALIVISFTAGARVARWAEAVEGAGGVEAGAAVFTGTEALLGHLAFIQVLVAGGP